MAAELIGKTIKIAFVSTSPALKASGVQGSRSQSLTVWNTVWDRKLAVTLLMSLSPPILQRM